VARACASRVPTRARLKVAEFLRAERRSSIGCKRLFWGSCAREFRVSGRLNLKTPGAVGELVFHVPVGIVARALLPHLPDDFKPALRQRAQGLSVGFAALAQGVVIGLRPSALFAALVGKEVQRVTQAAIACPA